MLYKTGNWSGALGFGNSLRIVLLRGSTLLLPLDNGRGCESLPHVLTNIMQDMGSDSGIDSYITDNESITSSNYQFIVRGGRQSASSFYLNS